MDNNTSASDMLNLFTAENLLLNTPIMGQVQKLRDDLSRSSDGTIVDYDAMLLRIQAEVDDLPSLSLQMNVPSGSEGAYQRQLLHALEKINDDHDRVYRKVIKLKSRLINAITLMKSQRSQFAAFFSLAFPIAIHATNIPKLKMTAKAIERMADGEYSRLMDNLDQAAPSFISELEILELEIKSRKAGQVAKYSLGKDQVNAMWNSIQSNGAIGLDDNPEALLLKFPLEEDGDEIPSFVSRHTKEVRVAASSSIVRPPETLCLVCGEKQFECLECPSGITCINDEDGFQDIKGTFVKMGDPKPITLIVDDESETASPSVTQPTPTVATECSTPYKLRLGEALDAVGFKPVTGKALKLPEGIKVIEDIEILNDPEPLATPALTTPRKKLMLMDEEF